MRLKLAIVGVLPAMLAAPALAHHSFAMFDNTKTMTWSGTVVDYEWANPHTHIVVMVPTTDKDQGQADKWDIEGASPNIMSRQGWNKNSFKPGDKITVVGHPLRDGGKGGSLFYAIGKDGKRLYHDVNRSGGPGGDPGPAPKG